ncbi:MAG: YARHG domain-containing protein, partial [Blautia sp.]|nr:YARHG domain-containing protein [Blautia sp.]
EETTTEETSAEETTTEETSAEETTIEETPAEETITEETSAEETVTEEIFAEETVTEETSAAENITEEISAEEPSTEETFTDNHETSPDGYSEQDLKSAEVIAGTYWIIDPDHPSRVVSIKNSSSMFGAYVTLRDGEFENPDVYQLFDIVKDKSTGKYLLLCHFSNRKAKVPAGPEIQALYADTEGGEQQKLISQGGFSGGDEQYWDILEDGQGYVCFRSVSGTWVSKPEEDSKKLRLTEEGMGWRKNWVLRKCEKIKTEPPQENGRIFVKNGYYEIHSAMDENKVLLVSDGSSEEDETLEICDIDKSANFVFYIERQPDNCYKIVNADSEKTISVKDNIAESGAGLLEKTYHASKGQKWYFYKTEDDHYMIRSALGTALDCLGGSTTDGTRVMMIEPNSGDNQKWDLKEVLETGEEFAVSVNDVVIVPETKNSSEIQPIQQAQPEPAPQEPPVGNSFYYIIPDSNTRYLTVEELRKYDMATLRLARNEIYARKGRRFRTADLQAYFDAQPWYYGYIDPDAFDRQEKNYLNQYEQTNARLILKYEKGEIG